jgi:hypothetical protein
MIFRRGARLGTLAFAALISLGVALPGIASAQQAPRRGAGLEQALSAANLRPDQQARINQMIADERAKARGEAGRRARRADRRQLRAAIARTLDPNQRAAFEGTFRQVRAERRAAKLERRGSAQPQAPGQPQAPEQREAPAQPPAPAQPQAPAF